jgi:Caspase domain
LSPATRAARGPVSALTFRGARIYFYAARAHFFRSRGVLTSFPGTDSMKKNSTLLRLTLLSAAALALLLPPAPSSARQAEGRGLVIARAEDGREVRLYERSYALVVGVSDYTNGWPKLPGVKEDIEAVARALESHGFLVTKVENPDSTQLDKSFKTFIDAYGPGIENRLVFYFAGHGHTVKQSYGDELGYIVPADAPLPARDPSGFMSKAMDMQQMELYARRIQSKHALFLFDSCFSGALFALSRAVPESISYKTARPVRQFITSGSADEQVPDRSIFRRQFVEAIEGEADANKDGYVTGTEIGEFLQDRVVNYSRNAQHPQYGKIRNPNLDKGDFVFALSKAAAPRPAVAGGSAPPATPPGLSRAEQAAVELAFWDTIKNSTDPDDFDAYLKKFPNGEFADIARRRIQKSAPAALAALDGTPPTNNAVPPAASTTRTTDAEVEQAVLALQALGTGRLDLGKFGEALVATRAVARCQLKYEERALWNSKARFKPTVTEVSVFLPDINITSIGVSEVKPPDRPSMWVITARTIQGRTFIYSVTGYENRTLEKVKIPTKTENPTLAGVAGFMDSESANRYAKAFANAARLCGAKSETF